MKLIDFLSVIPFYETNQPIEHIKVNLLEMDSRKVKQGDLFICIRGFTVDGHDYVEEAVQNGASAVISEEALDISVPTILVPNTSSALSILASKLYHYPTDDLRLIGITGTNGKTTITYLLEAIFKEHKEKTGIIGTIQMKIGDESYPLANTTPDALHLQKSFRQMVDEKVSTACMEVSSHALDLGRVHGCNYDLAIFTNLSQDHLDYHENMDNYFQAKSLLFSQLGNAYHQDEPKFAILNADDPHCEALSKCTAQHVITYGCKNASQVMATNIKMDIVQTSFTLETPIGSIQIDSQLTGMFNVYNMLAATSAAIVENVPLEVIKQALEKINGVDGRFEQVNEGQDFAVIVDYAHTPDSLENVLTTIKDFSEQNIYVVVGCGGDRDRSKRPLMAEIAVQHATKAIFTSDNPRTEDPQLILDDMTNGLAASNYEVVVDRAEAINKAVNGAEANDVILIAGKGHETYQQIGQVKHEFDDREVARIAIRSLE